MQARDVALAVTQWSTGIKPTWTISDVRNALRQHADGLFQLSAQLVDSFGEDDLIPGLEEKRIDAVLGSDFCLEPVDEPNAQLSKRLATKYGPLWWDMFPEGETGELLKWFRMLGVGVAVLDWERTANSWTPHLRTLHPQFLRFDQARRIFVYTAQEGELDVTPGDGKWILLTDGSRGWMRGMVRSLAINWIAKQLTIRDWNRYNERHGLPIILARAPAIADSPDQEAFWDDIKSLGSETVAQLPSDLNDKGARFDLELLEAKDGSYASFKDQLDRIDRRTMITVLGSNLATEVNGAGSLAATTAHRGVEVAKATADAQKLSTELRRQALFPAIAFNYAGTRIDVVPWPKWDTEPPEDDKTQADAAAAIGLAFKNFSDAGYDVENLDEVEERYGVKLVKRAVVVPVAPTPVTTLGVGSGEPDTVAPAEDNPPPADDAAAAE